MKIGFRKALASFFTRRRGIALAALPAAAILTAGAALLAAAPPRCMPGVTLEGVDVGGMDIEEARGVVRRLASDLPALTVRLGDTVCELGPADTGLSCDEEGTLADLRALGPSDRRLRLTWDEAKVEAWAENAAQKARRAYRPASWTVSEARLTLYTGQSGQYADAAALARAVTDRLAAGDRSALDFPVTRQPVRLPTVEELAAAADREPADAVRDTADPFRAVLSDEQPGRKLDRDAAAQVLAAAQEGRSYTIRCFRLEPSVTRRLLEDPLYRDTLSTGSTTLNTANRDRTNNVRLACEALDGTLVGAGETFSFNAAVGPRTYGAGYRDATVFREGEKVDDVGGGVCQVSSTLYMAALRAGMETVERQNHRFAVGYAPLGEDAAVYWDSVDFRFRNPTDWPLRIDSRLEGDTVTVTLTGTNEHPERRTEPVTEILSVTEPADTEEPDGSLAPGQRRQRKAGQRGYTTVTYRVVYENDREISRTVENRSAYQKEDRLWAVGIQTEAAGTVPGWLT